MKAVIIFVKVFVLAALILISNHNLALIKPEARTQFVDLYLAWLDGFYTKGLEVTGYVVRSEWLPSAEFELGR